MKQIFKADLGPGYYQWLPSGKFEFTTDEPYDPTNSNWVIILNNHSFIVLENNLIFSVGEIDSCSLWVCEFVPIISLQDLSAIRQFNVSGVSIQKGYENARNVIIKNQGIIFPRAGVKPSCTTPGNCSLGHIKGCPEYKGEMSLQEFADAAAKALDPGEPMPIGMTGWGPYRLPPAKCECGSEAVGSSGHSSYCPKFEE